MGVRTIIAVSLIILSGLFVKAPVQKLASTNQSIIASSARITTLPRASIVIGSKKFSVEIAETEDQQALGLGLRLSLAKNSGMLFPFDPSSQPYFWMKDMQFALDIVWINNGRVIGVTRNLPAPRPGVAAINLPTYEAPGSVNNVLEINAGQAVGIQQGDMVTIFAIKNL